MTPRVELAEIYQNLLKHFGKQHWWPAETRFEVIIGAILTQQTIWKNVELAIKNLKDNGLLDPHLLTTARLNHVEALVRHTGFYRQKGVDVLLAIDMLSMAFQNHYEIAIFLGGDDDFVDLINAVKNSAGKRVFGFYYPHRISRDSSILSTKGSNWMKRFSTASRKYKEDNSTLRFPNLK